ncbi:MAG: YceH family protein [Proteobacteria bacterium]|nr:YceH family protein [Pseudomonadota bacterium]
MTTETNQQEKTFFTQLEARVVASLMEKQLTTPNNYPLTLNSLVLACNQKSNRDPVMNLTQGQVEHTVNVLRDKNLAGIDYAGRANHITHRVMTELKLDTKTQSILTVLMLRAPQTLNDIKLRTNRMVDFDDVNEIKIILDEMIDRDDSYVIQTPKALGSREDRYTHTLCGEVKFEQKQVIAKQIPSSHTSTRNINELESLLNRLKKLEKRVEELE